MKKIEAIIKPFKLEDLKYALHALGVSGMTVTEVTGLGQPRGQVYGMFPPPENLTKFLPRMLVEVVVTDGQVKSAIDTIVRVCRTGKRGDGIILVSPVEHAIRVRTEDTDDRAI